MAIHGENVPAIKNNPPGYSHLGLVVNYFHTSFLDEEEPAILG